MHGARETSGPNRLSTGSESSPAHGRSTMRRSRGSAPRTRLRHRLAQAGVVALLAPSGLALVAGGRAGAAAPTATILMGPSGSVGFGKDVEVLPNGNFVVVDFAFTQNVGAVYLYDGVTLGVISVLTGNLPDDKVGYGGIQVLPDGNFLVRSPDWKNGTAAKAGALTWVSGTTGLNGQVSSANSLVGTTTDDRIGSDGVAVLANDNYVVSSGGWDNGALVDAGAATWVRGATRLTGPVTTANSLHGTQAFDRVGYDGVYPLANGNYVVSSPFWSNGGAAEAGAVTWADGTTGLTGPVSAANSLYGPQSGDQVGSSGTTALTNGNYVVSSPLWFNPANGGITGAGAVTWAAGATGLTGPVSTSNSLHGTNDLDLVGEFGALALPTGDYVVVSPAWDSDSAVNAGAVTWANGATGLTGPVTTANSLHGTQDFDEVGDGGVTALTNGNYVVSSDLWNNGAATEAGAVTWVNAAGNRSGPVTTANSLFGTQTGDQVGHNGVTALTNGNFVVLSEWWDNGVVEKAGAVTWANGATGLTGAVSTSNSLYGTTALDEVGIGQVLALENGDYDVASYLWYNAAGTSVGAVTRANGATGLTGAVSTSNSLYGSTAGDYVGLNMTALPNNRVLLVSYLFDNVGVTDAGAITLVGQHGLVGPVTSANSLIGTDPLKLGYVQSSTPTTAGQIAVPTNSNRVVLVDAVHDLISTAPGRLADTRTGGRTVDGQFAGAGQRPAGSTYEVVVAGRGGVPADATGVALNVTATGTTGEGYLTVWPCGTAQPNASNLNYTASIDIANAAITALGAGGKVCVYTSTATDLIVDVNGALPADTSFTTMNPARLHDSRSGGRTVDGREQGGGPAAAGSTTKVQVTERAGVAKSANAAIVNVTVDGTVAPGYLTVYPCGTAQPNASNLNYAAGATVAAFGITKLGADGTICVFTSAAAQLIVDVSGYIPVTTTYRPHDPARLLDTRTGGRTIDGQGVSAGLRPAGSITEVQISGRVGLGTPRTAVVTVTATNQDAGGYLTMWPCGQTQPNASNLNFQAGVDIANTAIVPVGTGGKVCIYASAPTNILTDVNGTFPT